MGIVILSLAFIGNPSLSYDVAAYETMADCASVRDVMNENLDLSKAYAYCEKGNN